MKNSNNKKIKRERENMLIYVVLFEKKKRKNKKNFAISQISKAELVLENIFAGNNCKSPKKREKE